MRKKASSSGPLRQAGRYVFVGVVTIAPLWVTWLVFDLLLAQLSKVGAPWLGALAGTIRPTAPGVADWLVEGWLTSVLAALTALALLYGLGWFASRVIGRRIVDAFDALMRRIPMVAAIYGATKRFLAMLDERPAGVQRVVLIPFPTPEMRALGFVTRVMEDADTGEKHAAVYVPTAPNPTSGYIEIVPLSQVVSTDWTMDEAMSFVITGGASGPATVRFAPGTGPTAPADASAAPAGPPPADRDGTAR